MAKQTRGVMVQFDLLALEALRHAALLLGVTCDRGPLVGEGSISALLNGWITSQGPSAWAIEEALRQARAELGAQPADEVQTAG